MEHTIKIDDTGTVLIEIDGQWINLDTLVDAYRAHCDTLTGPYHDTRGNLIIR